jgi:F-box/leucine-rich repeat protein 2/20
MTDSDLTSEVSLSSQLSSRASDGLSFMCTSEINYSRVMRRGKGSGYVVLRRAQMSLIILSAR